MDLGDRDSTHHYNRFKKPTQSKRSSGTSVHTVPMVSIPASEKLYSDGSQREVSMNLSSSQSNLKCYLCNGNHELEVCDKFKWKNGVEQFKFVHSKKLCDNCLSPFHFAAGCKRSKSCNISGCNLKQKHLISLHEPILLYERSQRRNRNGDNIDVRNSKSNGNSEAPNGFVGLAGGNSQTGDGCEMKALSIVSVKVKGRSKGMVIETYALLDNCSMATFCTEQLLEDLGVHGKKCE